MRDIRRFSLVCFFQVLRRFFTISKPSEWCPIEIDIPGRLENGGDAKAVLEMVRRSDESTERLLAELFGTLLVIDVACV
jgi:hypothetical protein